MGSTLEIKSGKYWRARVNLSEDYIPAGTILLVQSVKKDAGEAHTIVLLPHPSLADRFKEHRFFVSDFLNSFEPVSDEEARSDREASVARLQRQVADLQHRLASPQNTDKEEFVRDGLSSWEKEVKIEPGKAENLPVVTPYQVTLSPALKAENIDNIKLALKHNAKKAELQAAWIKTQTEELSNTIAAIVPYISEQAAAALASTEEIRTEADRLYRGVESLDLYVLKNVEIKQLGKGKSAPDTIPLTVKQAKLFMDEEFSVWAEVGESFDWRQQERFFQELAKSDSLRDQIFPTERSILCMATTRRNINYGNPYANLAENEINREVFLLVRDGDNLFVVWSPVESHLRSDRLFPTREEMEKIFAERSYDWKKSEDIYTPLDYEDTRYTDKIEEFERVALHYKRFLILLAGLDQHKQLFGRFYAQPGGANLLSGEFQKHYLHMLRDDETVGLRIEGEKVLHFSEYLASKNRYLQSGSRVICFWSDVMSSETAPGAVKEQYYNGRNSEYFYAQPTEKVGVQVAYQEGKKILVKAPVKNCMTEREYQAAVDLTSYRDSALGFLVLDAVKADELDWYIHNRVERRDFLGYISLFKQAVAFLRKEEAAQAFTRASLVQALVDSGVLAETRAKETVDQAIVTYRAANRGAELPGTSDKKQYQQLLNQIYQLANADQLPELAAILANEKGLTPLRLAVRGSSVIRLYCAPKEEEIDNRLFPSPWVHRLSLNRTKKGLSVYEDKWVVLPEATATESVVKEWPEASNWVNKKAPISKDTKEAAMCAVETLQIPDWVTDDILSLERFEVLFAEWKKLRDNLNRNSKMVQNPSLQLPVGVVCVMHRKELKVFNLRLRIDGAQLLYHKAPSGQSSLLVQEYGRVYQQPIPNVERLKSSKGNWELDLVPVEAPMPLFVNASYSHSLNQECFKGERTSQDIIKEWLGDKAEVVISPGFLNYAKELYAKN